MNVVGVRFKEVGKINYYMCNIDNVLEGDFVVAETFRGIEFGKVLVVKRNFEQENQKKLKNIVRKASERDVNEFKRQKAEEKRAFAVCEKKIAEHNLKMKLIEVDYIFDRSKIIFYFSAEGRVDFRGLVKNLAYAFKMRIELRQIGLRDAAKKLGGLGICGRKFCCSSFLNDFQAVTVKMAKEQGLPLNPIKTSGICGRLLCCLKYEEIPNTDQQSEN